MHLCAAGFASHVGETRNAYTELIMKLDDKETSCLCVSDWASPTGGYV